MGSASSIATRIARESVCDFYNTVAVYVANSFVVGFEFESMTCNLNSVCNFNGAVAVYVAEEDFIAFSSDIPAFAGVNDDGEF